MISQPQLSNDTYIMMNGRIVVIFSNQTSDFRLWFQYQTGMFGITVYQLKVENAYKYVITKALQDTKKIRQISRDIWQKSVCLIIYKYFLVSSPVCFLMVLETGNFLNYSVDLFLDWAANFDSEGVAMDTLDAAAVGWVDPSATAVASATDDFDPGFADFTDISKFEK